MSLTGRLRQAWDRVPALAIALALFALAFLFWYLIYGGIP